MGYYAIIKGEEVDGIAISDSPLDTDGMWIEVTNMNPMPQARWSYKNGAFIAPPEPEPFKRFDEWVISKVAMISRLTNAEYVGIVSASKSDPAVEAWYDMFLAASKINLKDQRTIDGLNFLVSKSLLTQARATEILTTPAAPGEI